MANKIKIIIISVILFLTCILVLYTNINKPQETLNPVKIVYISDNNYVNPLRASIRSVIKNSNKKTNISVIGVDLSEKNSKKILNEGKKKAQVNIIPISGNDFQDLKAASRKTPNVSRSDNAKFFLASILKDLDKVIYLDADTIVLKDLSGLYNTEMGDNYIGAADDWQTGWENDDKRYFNNGVMLLNLKKMREDNIEKKLIDYKKNDKINRFVTQDAFNNVMFGKVVYLSLIYDTFAPEYDNENVLIRIKQTLGKYYDSELYSYKTKNDFENDVAIIHYCGYNNLKPWHKINLWRKSGRIWYCYAPLDFWTNLFKRKIKKSIRYYYYY